MRPCYLCKSKELDEIKYGKYLTRGKISVHYFCLLLTSNLLQKGHDGEGFLGFLPADIEDEAARVAPVLCCYCKKASANISCCAPRCHKSFHLICGIQNDSLNQFVGTFKSFCNRHVPGQKLRQPPANEICCICYENIRGDHERFSAVNHLRAPCCRNGWFHKRCLASFADSAGYFFKCPLCNDTKLFRERLSKKGIFIPDRDAAWELEHNAYAELLERPTKCSADTCKAKGGRTNSNIKLINCETCGSIAIHRKCMKKDTIHFHCDECTSFIASVDNASFVNISASQHSDTENEEDEYVEVCEEGDDSSRQNNSQRQDSEEDEGTVVPLGRTKNNRFRIFDDSIESPSIQRKHSDTGDAESLFDSGAETDRSANSGDNKLNLNNSSEVSVSDSSQKPESEPESCRADIDTMASIRLSSSYSLEKLDNDVNRIKILRQNKKETSRAATRYASLNDSPSENMCIAKRTRRQSMNAEIALNSPSAEEDVKIESVPELSRELLNKIKTELGESCCKYESPNDENSLTSAWNSSKFPNSAKKTHSRSRTHSDDSSILRSPYSTLPQMGHNGCESSELFKSATNKRSRSDSMPDTEISQNKRLKNTSTLANRNEVFDVHSIRKRAVSRGKSPLGSNSCSLYAFLTPSYVKNRNPPKQDTFSATDDVVLPTGTAILEGEELFNTNKPNISKAKTKDIAVTANKTETSRTPTTIINYNRSPQETFLNSYSILIESPVKPRPHKPRNKRVFKEYSNQDLPTNQTKIESFFKRL